MGEIDNRSLISVIVPIYKVEPYLHQCVDSILTQTYTNLEIILVDDGSPDRCGKICDEYAEKDERVKVIHKENGGLSDTRNAGMAICTGEYISFVDSDDLLPADAFASLLSTAQKNSADIVIGNCLRFTEDPNFPQQIVPPTEKVLTPSQAMEDFFHNSCASWARLYKRSVHINIPFPKGEINEDEAIVLQLYANCERVVLSNHIVYGYRKRPGSITTSTFSPRKLDWYRHCKANLKWVRDNQPELEEAAASRYRSSLLWLLTEIALSDGDYRKETRRLIGELKKHRKLFRQTPFKYPTDKIRTVMLLWLPFPIYRAFIRLKRKT